MHGLLTTIAKHPVTKSLTLMSIVVVIPLIYLYKISYASTPQGSTKTTAGDLSLRDYASILAIIASVSALVLGYLKYRSDRDKDRATLAQQSRADIATGDVNAMTASFRVLERHIEILTEENHEYRDREDLYENKIKKLEEELQKAKRN